MIPYDLDPSLYAHEPEAPLLDDGFSPPPHHDDAAQARERGEPVASGDEEDAGLGPKSLF